MAAQGYPEEQPYPGLFGNAADDGQQVPDGGVARTEHLRGRDFPVPAKKYSQIRPRLSPHGISPIPMGFLRDYPFLVGFSTRIADA